MQLGIEWLVDAQGCRAERLRDLSIMRYLLDEVVSELKLSVVSTPHWHQFPGEGGVTGLYLLTESHLACHTYPEHRAATFNLYCCQVRNEWDWANKLARHVGAQRVLVRTVPRQVEVLQVVDRSQPPAKALG